MTAPLFLFEFHDSEVSEVRAEGPGRLLLRFSAASVQQVSEGVAGHVRSLELLLVDAEVEGPVHDAMGRLAAGELLVDGSHVHPLPLPFAAEGTVRLSLRFNNGAQLSVAARAAEFRFGGEPRFMESYAC